MTTYIALLRGINVSGQKKVPMAVLRELLSKSGFKKIGTYIQSGNVIFQSLEQNKSILEKMIQSNIQEHFGFLVPTLVKAPEEIRAILDEFPFSEEKREGSYFTLLYEIPSEKLVNSISKEVCHNEEFIIKRDCVYFYPVKGYGKTKCDNNFFERKLNITATTRNYKTMLKLLSLSSEIE